MNRGLMRLLSSIALLLLCVFSGFGEGKKALVIYYSMPERDAVDAVAGASRLIDDGKVAGNTQWIAEVIREATGGDMYEIATMEKYPATHAALVERAQTEKEKGFRPGIKAPKPDLAGYDVIFLGYPIWWADLPMPLYSFLEGSDFSGKTIVPFSTHGGSGFADTIDTLARLEPKAKIVKDGFTVSRNSVSQSRAAVVAWAKRHWSGDARIGAR